MTTKKLIIRYLVLLAYAIIIPLGRYIAIIVNFGVFSNSVDDAEVLLYFLVMTALVLIEDTYVIFFVDVYTIKGLSIFNRNISENLLFVGFAIGFCVYTWKNVNELLVHAASLEEESAAPPMPTVDGISAFVESFNLTERETEILRCLLDGKSHQEISQTLVIALGTVKTHTHNIYAKAGVANRSQIITKYEEFLSSQEVK